jgi:hypothetical protein
MADVKPEDLSGLWYLPFDEEPDESLAPAHLHGTYVRKQRFLIVMSEQAPPPQGRSARGLQYGILDVFDGNGDFSRFVWDPNVTRWNQQKGAWVSKNEIVTFPLPTTPLANAKPLRVPPTLALARRGDPNFPKEPGSRPEELPARDRRRPLHGDACPVPFGPPVLEQLPDGEPKLRTRPSEYIGFNPESPETLEWVQPDAVRGVVRIRLDRAPIQEHRDGDGADRWGDAFQGHTYPQIDALYIAYKPRRISLFQGAISGTDRFNWNGQSLNGRPIFAYPKVDSMDYVKSSKGDGKVLPLGVHYIAIEGKTDWKETVLISSERDHSQSQAYHLGLGGGLEGLLKTELAIDYSTEEEKSLKMETRYTVSKSIVKRDAVIADPANLTLLDSYKAELRVLLTGLYANGSIPDTVWDAFESAWGSHYACAVTWGSIKLLQTKMTLKTEARAVKKGLKLKTEASGAFESFSGKGTASGEWKWGEKLSDTVQREDMQEKVTGDGEMVPIFLDLRPTTELLSPLFLPYSTGVPGVDESLAPFFWYTLRRSWHDYLKRKHGLDRALHIGDDDDGDYTPTIFKVTFSELSGSMEDPNAFRTGRLGDPHDWPQMYGDLQFEGLNGAPILESEDYHVKVEKAVSVDNNRNIPGADTLICILGGSKKAMANAGLRIHGTLYNYHRVLPDDRFDIDFRFDLNGPSEQTFTFSKSGAGYGRLKMTIKIERDSARNI